MQLNIGKSGNGNNGGFHVNKQAMIHLPGSSPVLVPSPESEVSKGHPGTKRRLLKPVEIAIGQFADGTRVRLIEDPKDRTRTLFAVWRAGHVDLVDKFEYGQEVFVPPKGNDPLIKAITLPRGVQPYDTPSAMARGIGRLLNEVMPLTEDLQCRMRTFALLTWVSDGLPFSPTVAFYGPRDIAIPLLQTLALFCRYGLLIGDATPAGLLETCSRIRPTLLIVDYGLRRDTVRLLEMGSRCGILSLQQGGAFSPCCPRVIACSEASLGRDLVRGGVVIPLPSFGWLSLDRVCDPQFLERADCLRRCLLQYDLERNGSIRPLGGGPPRDMKPREWDVFRWWGAPFAGDEGYLKELREAMRWEAELSPDGIPVEQYATISALEFLAHEHRPYASVGEMAALVNKVLEQMGEELRVKDRKVGAILAKLGFPRRERGGDDGPYQFQFTESSNRKVHRLVESYGRWEVELYSRQDPRVMCELCREYKLVSDGDMRRYEKELKPAEERRKRKEQGDQEKKWERLRKNPPRPIFNGPGRGIKRIRGNKPGRRKLSM